MAKPIGPEQKIKKEIIAHLERSGYWVKLHQSRGMKMRNHAAGLGKGTPDIAIVLKPWGRHVWLEVKDPNRPEADGNLSDAQKDWHAKMREHGGLVYMVTSVDDADEAILDAELRCDREYTPDRTAADD